MAIIKKACKDEGASYLDTDSAYFYKALSKTDNNDYKQACRYYERKKERLSIDKIKKKD